MKLTFEEKKEIVRLHEKEGHGCDTIAVMFKVCSSTIKAVLRRYQIHGEDSLRHPAKRSKYTAEFKMTVVKRALDGEAKTALAAEYGIKGGTGAIISWIHKYDESGYNGLVSKQGGRPG